MKSGMGYIIQLIPASSGGTLGLRLRSGPGVFPHGQEGLQRMGNPVLRIWGPLPPLQAGGSERLTTNVSPAFLALKSCEQGGWVAGVSHSAV